MPPLSRRELAIAIPASLIAGFFVGVLGTFKHQVGVSAATGGGVPWGAAAALAMVALLLAALRLAFRRRALPLAAAIGVLAGVALLATPGPGGSEVILPNSAGYAWTIGAVVVSVAAVAWPLRGPGPREADGILDADRTEGTRL